MQDSPVGESTKICNGDALIDGAQSMTNEDEMLDVEQVLRFENGIDEMQESLLPCFQQFLMWPPDDCVTIEWVQDVMVILEQASQKMLPSEFCHVVPTLLVDKLTDAAFSILCKEPNCVEINCLGEDSRVIVVGDLHGQFHDLMFLFKHAGLPSENQIYVFNGNYVDKGAWGIEVFLVLLAWKVRRWVQNLLYDFVDGCCLVGVYSPGGEKRSQKILFINICMTIYLHICTH